MTEVWLKTIQFVMTDIRFRIFCFFVHEKFSSNIERQLNHEVKALLSKQKNQKLWAKEQFVEKQL